MAIIEKLTLEPQQHKIGRKLSSFKAMELELRIYYRAVELLSSNIQAEPFIQIPITMNYMYVVELGLKMLSYKSHPGNLNDIDQDTFKKDKNILATGIYKVNNTYYHIIQPISHKNPIYKLKQLEDKSKVRDRISRSIEEKLKLSVLSQDELFAIFENYTPYPQTHKLDDIFNSIKLEYKKSLLELFKYYHINYLAKNNASIDKINFTKELSIEIFEKMLCIVPDFTKYRYISANSGIVTSHGPVIGSLASAIFGLLENIKKNINNSSSLYQPEWFSKLSTQFV